MAHFVTLEHLAQSKHKLNALVSSEKMAFKDQMLQLSIKEATGEVAIR